MALCHHIYKSWPVCPEMQATDFKVLSPTYQYLHGTAPSYLQELTSPYIHASSSPSSSMSRFGISRGRELKNIFFQVQDFSFVFFFSSLYAFTEKRVFRCHLKTHLRVLGISSKNPSLLWIRTSLLFCLLLFFPLTLPTLSSHSYFIIF